MSGPGASLAVSDDDRPHRRVHHSYVARASDTLVGLSFDSTRRAWHFVLTMRDLEARDALGMVDAVVVVEDGHVLVCETIDPQPGRSMLSAAAWTGLVGLIHSGPVGWVARPGVGAGIGAAAAQAIDLGIPDEWVRWFEEVIAPDTGTVLVLASEVDLRALRAEADRFPDVRLVQTTIRTAALTELRSAFDDNRGAHR